MRRSQIIILAIILASFIVSIYLYPQLPDELASHWNAHGKVDGYMPKAFALFIMPAVSIFTFLLFMAIPRIDPLKQNIAKFRKYFDVFVFVVILFLFYLHLLTITWNLGFTFNIVQALLPAFAGLFFYVGVLLEKSKRNWFIGLRTPWTLSSDKIWDKTHKLGGKLFKAFSIVALLGILIPNYAFYFILVAIFAVTIYLVVYSYFEFKKEHKQARKQTGKRARKKKR